ncbi:ABC transporter ATP-binding protein [Saccharopolyspora griseoalba]|uniref:ABC transporter ATP-binding protein n=1 Tax=Saccharopolyspora griseoalba TaxID=1431848 RepID=A0ABW2LEB6_9PSEU
MIRTRNLELTYADQPRAALEGIDLELRTGEVLGVVGSMGAGKTSLCMTLAGLAPRSTGGTSGGDLDVGGIDPRSAPMSDVAQRVSLVFEDYASQLTQITVLSEVMAPLINRGTPVSDARQRARRLLEDLGLGHLDLERKRTWELSGGQQQRVAIAAALAGDPQLLMLDNVTGLLDPTGKEEIRQLVGELSARMTLVVVEDDVDLLVGVADQVLVLQDGIAKAHGSAATLLRDVDLLADAQVEPPTVVQIARAADLRSEPLTTDELAAATRPIPEPPAPAAGRSQPVPDLAAPPRDWAVEVRDVDYRYRDGTAAVQDVSLQVEPGRVHAVVGGNGAGKSTLMRLLCGLLRPSTGEVLVGGRSTSEHSPAELATAVGTALQNPDEQITERTVREEVAYPLRQRRLRRRGWFRREVVLSDEQIDEAVERARLLAGIPDEQLDADPTHLSRGCRKLVAIAGALALEPAVLVLDEPRVSLDAPGRATLRNLLHQLRDRGTAVVMVEHDLDLVAETADSVTLLERGRVVAGGSPREVFGADGAEALARTSLLPPRAAQVASHLGVEAFSVAELAAQLDSIHQEA